MAARSHRQKSRRLRVTRSYSGDALLCHHLWWHGPCWLKHPRSEWRLAPSDLPSDALLAEKIIFLHCTKPPPLWNLATQFSSCWNWYESRHIFWNSLSYVVKRNFPSSKKSSLYSLTRIAYFKIFLASFCSSPNVTLRSYSRSNMFKPISFIRKFTLSRMRRASRRKARLSPYVCSLIRTEFYGYRDVWITLPFPLISVIQFSFHRIRSLI